MKGCALLASAWLLTSHVCGAEIVPVVGTLPVDAAREFHLRGVTIAQKVNEVNDARVWLVVAGGRVELWAIHGSGTSQRVSTFGAKDEVAWIKLAEQTRALQLRDPEKENATLPLTDPPVAKRNGTAIAPTTHLPVRAGMTQVHATNPQPRSTRRDVTHAPDRRSQRSLATRYQLSASFGVQWEPATNVAQPTVAVAFQRRFGRITLGARALTTFLSADREVLGGSVRTSTTLAGALIFWNAIDTKFVRIAPGCAVDLALTTVAGDRAETGFVARSEGFVTARASLVTNLTLRVSQHASLFVQPEVGALLPQIALTLPRSNNSQVGFPTVAAQGGVTYDW